MEEFDVIIVGAGASGGILALELMKKGRRVLILEAGRGLRNDEEGWNSAIDSFYNAVAKVPNSPFPATAQAPQTDVLQFHQIQPGVPDSSGYLVQHGPQPFSSDYGRSKGGTTNHWLGVTLRMLPNDFKMRTKYGVGDDWPIGYEDLKSDYERAEFEIGVAGDVSAQNLPGVDAKKFWGSYQYPMKKIPEAYLSTRFKERLGNLKVPVAGKEYELYVTPTPQGRNSMPNPDYVNPVTGEKGFTPVGSPGQPLRGERCQGNASCVPICPVQAKYTAHRTLNKAQSKATAVDATLTLRSQSIASKIVTDPVNGRVLWIEYLVYDGSPFPPVKKTAKATLYSVAAHSVESAKLLLISNIANRSDQLGRNLMDHPTMMTWGLADEPLWPFRGPGATNAIPTFRDGPFRSEQAAFVLPIDNWGWVWSAFAPGAPFGAFVGQGLFGRKLRQNVAHDFSRQITLQWEFEQVGQPGNRVTIDPQYLDPVGLPRPVIHYKVDDYVRKSMQTAIELSERIFKKVGITDKTTHDPSAAGFVEYQGKPYEYRGCGHLVGTHRMGTNPSNSVTDSFMRCWDHENLFVVGCGSMPTFGTSNPSLTMAALAFRAADEMNRVLDKHSTAPSL